MLRGTCVSEGIGIGNAYIYDDFFTALYNKCTDVSYDTVADYTSEKARFERAVQIFLKNTEELLANLKVKLVTGTDEADILLSHTLIVKDEGFQNKVNGYLMQGQICEDAVVKVADEYRQMFLQSGDEELMLRSMDYFYEKLRVNRAESLEIEEWINQVRVDLKKNIIRKQNRDINNREIYEYLHDIFGASVIDIFDIKYDDESGEKN